MTGGRTGRPLTWRRRATPVKRPPRGAVAVVALALVLGSIRAAPSFAQERPLRIAAVQFRVTAAVLRSEETYRAAVSQAMEQAFAQGRPDLVIFPEYTGALATLLPYGDALSGATSVQGFLSRVRRSRPEIRTPRDFLAAEAESNSRRLRAIFGEQASRNEVWILAGSAFPLGPQGGLRNRALVFGPSGRLRYTQDKVFLTAFEQEFLGLSPGAVENVDGFEVAGWEIGLSICRDTFFEVWESLHDRRDLWIDIKANGEVFNEETRAIFRRALPARLPDTETAYGATVCLTGRVLDLFWEGRSSLITSDGPLSRTRSHVDQEVLYRELEPSGDD